MATTIKVKLRDHILKDGTSPIIFRITKNRKIKSVHFGKSVKPAHWREMYPWIKPGHNNSQRLNNFLLDRLTKVNNEILSIEAKQPNISLDELKIITKRIIDGQSAFPEPVPKPPKYKPSVYEFANEYLNIIKESGDFDRYRAERMPIRHLKAYTNNRTLFFSDLNVKFLKGFKAYLKGTRGVSERTAINNLIIIRTFFKLAIEEDIIKAKHYPFGRNKIRCKRPPSMKIGLEENELLKIEATALPKDHVSYDARNIWLLSYYFAGIRGSDALKLRWNRFKNGRLYYAMSKNLKADSFKIPEKAQRILDLYQNPETKPDDLIFPFLILDEGCTDKRIIQKACKRGLQKIGRDLKVLEEELGLEKKLTMHVSRHSFATIAGDKIPMPMLQRLFRHSDISTTINYMAAFMYKDLDDALDRVVNFEQKKSSDYGGNLHVVTA